MVLLMLVMRQVAVSAQVAAAISIRNSPQGVCIGSEISFRRDVKNAASSGIQGRDSSVGDGVGTLC